MNSHILILVTFAVTVVPCITTICLLLLESLRLLKIQLVLPSLDYSFDSDSLST